MGPIGTPPEGRDVSAPSTPAEPKLAPPTPAAWVTVLSWTLPLWLLMIPIRAQVMGYGWYWLQSPLDQGRFVLAGAYLDLLYTLGLGAASWLLLKFARRAIIRRTILTLFITTTILSLLFALANVKVVPMIGHPLTYPWLYYSGFLHSYDALQAISAGASPAVALGAFLCIAVLVLLSRLIQRYLTARPLSWRSTTCLTILLLAYIPLSAHAMRDFHHPTLQNPVVVLASSMLGGADVRLFTISTSAPTTDFCTLAELPTTAPDPVGRAPVGRAPRPTSTAWGWAPRPPRADGASPAAIPTPAEDEAPAAPASPPTPQPPPIRNILFIVMESVGAQYLPAYGAPYPTTPNLDLYRNHSKLYRNIYAHAPSTNKSLVSLLCSIYPWPTYRFLTQEAPAASVISISDVLHAQGYRTALFSAADLRFGYAQSFLEHHNFDLLRDYRTIGTGQAQFISNESANHLNGIDDATVTQALTDWIQTDPQRPFFAVLWTNQTHYPYFPNAQTLAKATTQPTTSPGHELLTRYLAALQDSDAAIGSLLRDLDHLGLADSTLVVVLGDHGEAFGQHGRFGHGNRVSEVSSMGGNFGHGSDLYEENIHIPLLLINPRLFSGQEDPTLGGLVDIAPTILDHLQLPLPTLWQGRSLARPGDQAGRQRVYFTAPWSGAVFGYREGNRKYLFDAITDQYRVFDLAQDPAERSNLVGEYSPEQLKATYQQLAAWVQYQERLIRKVSQ